MELYYKKPSKEAREVMCEAIKHISSKNRNKFIQIAESEICNITRHKYSKVVNSGNSAILAVMSSFKDKIMVPDQGGWSGFIKIAQILGLEIIYLPTDWGLINKDTIHDIIREKEPEALFLTSFAGYTAEQPLKEIYEVCDEAGVVLVEDASGAVGDEEGKLANGNHSHVIIASTGSPKIVNVGNGGFISTNRREFIEDNYTLKALQADPITCAGISVEINNAKKILSKTISSCDYLKNKLDNVFHPDKRGINVIIKVKEPNKLAKFLRSELMVHGGGIISKCPRYDRVLDNAVALEIKNLAKLCLNFENMDKIIEIVNKFEK